MRVYDLRDQTTHREKVNFNGATTMIGSVYRAVQHLLAGKLVSSEVFLVVTRGNNAQMMFTCDRDNRCLYIHGVTPLADTPFTNWKTLLKHLECEVVDVTCNPHDYERHDDCRKMGLVNVSQRVKIAVARQAPLPEMVYWRLDEINLTQSVELGRIALNRSGRFGQSLLEGLALGNTTGVVVPNDAGDIVGALLYVDGEKEIQSEGVIINAAAGTPVYVQWFMLLMNAFIREAKRLRKPAIASFAPAIDVKVPIPHVETTVVTVHFGLAGREAGAVF